MQIVNILLEGKTNKLPKYLSKFLPKLSEYANNYAIRHPRLQIPVHKHEYIKNYDRSCTFHSIISSKHFCACVYVVIVVDKLSYLFMVLMGHTTMAVNIQCYFLSLNLISKWLTRDIG